MDEIAIGVGLGLFYTGLPEPEQLFQYAERADQLGIDSIWVPDHVISDYPALDVTVLLSTIAARTESIKMGPSVMTLPSRNPVEVASAYASLDYLTGGEERVIMAVGLGNDPRICESVGVRESNRADHLEEAIEVLRLLWTEDEVRYDGDHYQLDGVTVNPKPDHGPLDIWIGGNSDAALRRIARYGDGWFPAVMTAEQFSTKMDRLMRYCEEEGRQVEDDEAGMILLSYVSDDESTARARQEQFLEQQELDIAIEDFDRCSAFGTPDQCIETVRRYIDAGCTKFVLLPIGSGEDRIRQLEVYANQVIPASVGEELP